MGSTCCKNSKVADQKQPQTESVGIKEGSSDNLIADQMGDDSQNPNQDMRESNDKLQHKPSCLNDAWKSISGCFSRICKCLQWNGNNSQKIIEHHQSASWMGDHPKQKQQVTGTKIYRFEYSIQKKNQCLFNDSTIIFAHCAINTLLELFISMLSIYLTSISFTIFAIFLQILLILSTMLCCFKFYLSHCSMLDRRGLLQKHILMKGNFEQNQQMSQKISQNDIFSMKYGQLLEFHQTKLSQQFQFNLYVMVFGLILEIIMLLLGKLFPKGENIVISSAMMVWSINLIFIPILLVYYLFRTLITILDLKWISELIKQSEDKSIKYYQAKKLDQMNKMKQQSQSLNQSQQPEHQNN